MKSSKIVSRVLIPLLLLVIVIIPIGCTKPIDVNDFTVSLKAGYGNQLEIGKCAPFEFQVQNNSKDFEGTIQMIVPINESQNIMVEKQLSLGKNAQKTVTLVAPVNVGFHKVSVRLADKKGDVIWKDFQYCTVNPSKAMVNIGVLSDDFNALGYMDRQHVWGSMGLTTRIFEISEETFSNDWHALEPLDVIVISDYSTDILSEEQLNKLSLWVENGGFLLIGTGSTSKKTLAGTNGDLFTITPGNLKQINTRFGSENFNDFMMENVYANHEFSYMPPSDAEYNNTFDSFFYDNQGVFEDTYQSAFMYQYGLDDSDLAYYEQEFYDYCKEMYYYDYYLPMKASEEAENLENEVDKSAYVIADVLDFEWDGADEVLATTSANENFPLAKYKNVGEGYIMIAGVDFTKNPLASYKSNSQVFLNMISYTIGARLLADESSNNSGTPYYYGYGDYPIEKLGEKITGAGLPPTLLYIIILVLYLCTLPIVWVVLKRKKKTIKLWIAFPIAALSFGIVIYCLGFSTRISRPVFNVVTVSQILGGRCNCKSLAGLTIPKNHDYEVAFSDEYSLDMTALFEGISNYFDESEVNYDSYVVSYLQQAEATQVRMQGNAALQGSEYELQKITVEEDRVSCDFTYINSELDCTITNNDTCAIEDAMVYCNDYFYYIKSIKPGESIKLSDPQVQVYKWSYFNNYDKEMRDMIEDNRREEIFASQLLGTLYPKYDELRLRIASLEYFADTVLENYDENRDSSLFTRNASLSGDYSVGVWFIGFPTDAEEGSIQSGTKYRENQVEMLTIYFPTDEMAEQFAQGGN